MKIQDCHHYPEVGVPLFWPFGFAAELGEVALDTTAKTFQFLGEVEKTQVERPPPEWATENHVRLELHTLSLRDFSRTGDGVAVLVLPPYAGHTSTIADFHRGQSLVATLRDNGCPRIVAADWRNATPQMQYYDIDNYLAEINVCVDALGGKVALVGLCQGGWCAAMYAARFPDKIHRLVLAGSPIDTDAGDGAIKEAAHTLPMAFYEGLVRAGGGLLKGAFMLEGFKNMHPATQYFDKFAELYQHIDDPSYVARFERFERWYEYTLDLPGSWYLQVIREIFKENQLAKGRSVGLGKRLSLSSITCPVYLLAGDSDDITPKEQVFAAEKFLGTPPAAVQKDIARGGHIGLFMGHEVLQKNWLGIAAWLATPRPE